MVSNPLLESARAKLDRADHHFNQLDSELQLGSKQNAYGFRFIHETKTDELVLYALMPHHLFVRYSIIAGEIIHHARSALEHAVWEMATSASPGRRGFPVFTAETKLDAAAQNIDRYYDSDGVRMIDGMNPAAVTVIKGLQPFGPDYTNPLYILNELWNRDKHRLLNTCVAYPWGMSLIYRFPNGKIDAGKVVPVPPDVKDGTELFRQHHPGRDVKVEGEGAISAIVFEDGLVKGKPVLELLNHLVQFTKHIVDDLAVTF